MNGRGTARGLLLLGLLWALAACAPQLQPEGPVVSRPAIDADRLTMDDGARLPLRQWLPKGEPKAVILALHGFNDYSRAFAGPAAYWASQGIATFAFDQRGFGDTADRGLWAGDRRMMQDVRNAATLLRARYPGRPLFLLGESMGAALALAVADAPDPPAIAGLILLAPAIWGRDAQGPVYSTALWMAAHSVPWMTFTGEGLEVQPSDNIAMLRALGRDPLVIKATRVDTIYGLVGLMDRAWDAAPRLKGPALVVYGAHEEIIPPDVAMQMIRRLPPRFVAADGNGADRVAIYPQGYHMLLRDLHGMTVQEDVAAWIADPARRLPSGNEAVAVRLIGAHATTVKDAALPAPPTLVPEAAGGPVPATVGQAKG